MIGSDCDSVTMNVFVPNSHCVTKAFVVVFV